MGHEIWLTRAQMLHIDSRMVLYSQILAYRPTEAVLGDRKSAVVETEFLISPLRT
jgi:hypothetical protein